MEFDLTTGERLDSPTTTEFGDDMTRHQLKAAIREYAETVEIDVDLSEVEIEISGKLRRTAGKAIHNRTSGEMKMRFAWGAYREWGWEGEFQKTIRHELVHIWQYQNGSRGGHGWDFKQKARELDTPRHCPKFSDHKFEVLCSECDEMVARRFQRSKLVKQANQYRSKCCSAPCKSRAV